MPSFLDKYTDLQKRAITGFSGFFLILFCMIYNEWTFFCIFFGLCFLTLKEFYETAEKAGAKPVKYYGIFSAFCVYAYFFFFAKKWLSADYALFLYPILSLIFIIRLYQKNKDNAFVDIAFTFLGIFQVALPFALLHLAVFVEADYNYRIILSFLFLIWIHDIGAYFGGKFYGRTQLFARISPKKTWEGSVTGAVCTFIMVVILTSSFQGLNYWVWNAIGLIVIFTSTLGDLTISLYKRSIHLKDASNAIPGHGGFLDRFDGFLLASPFVVAFWVWIQFWVR